MRLFTKKSKNGESACTILVGLCEVLTKPLPVWLMPKEIVKAVFKISVVAMVVARVVLLAGKIVCNAMGFARQKAWVVQNLCIELLEFQSK